MRWSKILLIALTATVVLGLTVGTASASRLAVSEDEFDITWTELRLVNTDDEGQFVECPVTLLGRFHSRTITKTTNLLIGFIDHASVGEPEECVGGEATVLDETLPWHVRYRGISGTLPGITLVEVNLVNASFAVDIDGAAETCLFRTDTTTPALGNIDLNGSGQATSLSPGGVIRADSFICALGQIDGTFTGPGVVENRHGGLLFVSLV